MGRFALLGRVRLRIMSTADAEGHELVVADDGSIPAEQVAQLGLGPGSHVRVVVETPGPPASHKTAKGILAGKVDGAALVGALEDAKAERAALLGLGE
jgi:hypothetical protein